MAKFTDIQIQEILRTLADSLNEMRSIEHDMAFEMRERSMKYLQQGFQGTAADYSAHCAMLLWDGELLANMANHCYKVINTIEQIKILDNV